MFKLSFIIKTNKKQAKPRKKLGKTKEKRKIARYPRSLPTAWPHLCAEAVQPWQQQQRVAEFRKCPWNLTRCPWRDSDFPGYFDHLPPRPPVKPGLLWPPDPPGTHGWLDRWTNRRRDMVKILKIFSVWRFLGLAVLTLAKAAKTLEMD